MAASSDHSPTGHIAQEDMHMELLVHRQKEKVYARAVNQLEKRLDSMDAHMTECLQTTRVCIPIFSSVLIATGLVHLDILGRHSWAPTQP